MKLLHSTLKLWFPLAVTLTMVCGIIYLAGQQNYRQDANDPQYQMAEDAANAISHGADPKSLVSGTSAELNSSLSPYLIIFDEQQQPVASTILLNGQVPRLPSGVLAFVKAKGVDVITWKPREGMRQALVVTKTGGSKLYYVAAGRSLRLAEQRIALLGQQLTFWWLCSVVFLFVVVLGVSYISKPK
jgi:hypothetical protein